MAPDYVTLPHTDKGIRNFEIATWLGKCSVVKPHTIFEPYIKKQEGVENEAEIREEQQGLTKSKNEERIKKKNMLWIRYSVFSLWIKLPSSGLIQGHLNTEWFVSKVNTYNHMLQQEENKGNVFR